MDKVGSVIMIIISVVLIYTAYPLKKYRSTEYTHDFQEGYEDEYNENGAVALK